MKIKFWLVMVFGCVLGSHAFAEAGVSAKEIVIGQSAAFSGASGALGTHLKAGAEAYFKIVNEAGGVNGRKIRLVALDDAYEPARAEKNTRELIEKENVFALFGYVGTATSNAALPIFSEARVPFVGPFSGAESLRKPFNRYIFNIRASYVDETAAIVDYLKPQGLKRIGVLYQNDAYGQAGLQGVEQAMTKHGAAPLVKATIERNSTDVAKAVATISAAKPEAVIIVSAYKGSAAFTREMKKALPTVNFWNVSFVGSNDLRDELKEDGYGVAISQVVPFPWSDAVNVAKEHRQAMDGKQSFTSLEGFIAAKVLVEGLKRAGKEPTRESFVAALENASKIDVGGFAVSFSPKSHNGSTFVDLSIISGNGKFIR